MTDPNPTQVNPRPLVLDGLPTPYGLAAAAGCVAEEAARAPEARWQAFDEVVDALHRLADRLPALLAAEEEARKWRAVVAEAGGERGYVQRDGRAVIFCPSCARSAIWPEAFAHTPDCPHVAARGGA